MTAYLNCHKRSLFLQCRQQITEKDRNVFIIKLISVKIQYHFIQNISFHENVKKKVIPQVKIIKIEHYKILNKSKCKDGTKYFN